MNAYDILGLVPPVGSIARKNNKSNKYIQQGGNESQPASSNISSKDITLQNLTNGTVVEEYEPKITRPIMSIYEYAEVHTMLAEYLEAQRSIRNVVNDVEIRSTVNPAEVAFNVLREGKWDAVLDRGYEKVSYSKLKYNPQWESTCAHYFTQQHEAQKNELFAPLQLL